MVSRFRVLYSQCLKHDVAMVKLFWNWKNSIWQMIWLDLLIFLIAYYSLTLLYRVILSSYSEHQATFEILVIYCARLQEMIPLTFILGFFVSNMMDRWWSVTLVIPFIDKWAFYVHQFIPYMPQNPQLTLKLRSTILRYINLSSCLALRDYSKQAQRRFAIENNTVLHQFHLKLINMARRFHLIGQAAENMPTVRESLEAINGDRKVQKTFGELITEKEIETYMVIQDSRNLQVYEPENFVPYQWAMRLVTDAQHRKWIKKDRHAMKLIELINDYRGRLGTIYCYSAFLFPYVYLQVVIIGVYLFLLCEVIAYQYIKTGDEISGVSRDQYVPIFSILKFIFYMGWFKSAYAFVYPLGDSKYDCQINEIIDRNLEMSKLSGLAQDFMYPYFLQEEECDTSRERFKGALQEIKALRKEEKIKIYEEEQMQRADEEANAEHKSSEYIATSRIRI